MNTDIARTMTATILVNNDVGNSIAAVTNARNANAQITLSTTNATHFTKLLILFWTGYQ